MEMDKYEHGVPSWVDVGTDLEKDKPFYRELFGWDIQEGPAEAGGYSLCYLKGRTVCGMGPQMNSGPPAWLTYVNVDDADTIPDKVTGNGGAVIVGPMDVMTAGRMGIFADPQGAVFGIWQAGDHKGAGLVNEPGTWGWSELVTTDVDAAKAFYGAVFGWGAETHGEGQGAYTEWQVSGRSMGGAMLKPPMMPAEVPPHWAVYFLVTDADGEVARIQELGGSLLAGPMDIEPGRFAAVMDPAGAAFNILALKES